ncbi:hypothetical protein STEG23_019780, partial [Scotinomys teguina]
MVMAELSLENSDREPVENRAAATMRLYTILCLLLFNLGVASRHHFRSREERGKKSSVDAGVTPRSKDFIFNLYTALASEAPDQNVFFSSMSVVMSLSMLSLGTGPRTKTQILEGLGLSLQQEDMFHKIYQRLMKRFSQLTNGLQLSLGSALFMDPAVHIRDSFLSAVKTLYMADTFSTNFRNPEMAKKQINDYVANLTKGSIADFIKDLDSNHVMVLISYIFFKAKWEKAFSDKNTHQKDFYVTPKKTIQVPMMNREDEYYYILDQSLSCTVVRVPYQGNASALLILPSNGKMQQVENSLNGRGLMNWLTTARKRRVNLYLPKFSIEGTYQLEKILPKLGIRDIFTTHADLSGITDHPNIKLSQMLHKSVMEVDESGTIASAATGELFTFRSAQPETLKIEFNRPFLLVIEENMNVLFLGRVVQPEGFGSDTEGGNMAVPESSTQPMRRRAVMMALLVALGLLMAELCPAVLCQSDGTLGRNSEVQENQNNGTRVDSLTMASINTDFAFSLYKELALKNPDKNVVFSPLSISAALAVLSLGANNNTLGEILEGLKFNLTETPVADIHRGFGHLLHKLSQPGDQVQINIGSMIFVGKHLHVLAEFKEKARALFQAEASTVDFQQPNEAKKLINDYVSKQTQGKIKELISDLDEKTLMVLVNYIYFKGKWERPFEPHFTFESDFYLDEKRTVKVPMMNDKFLTTPYFRDEDLFCTVVELKYTGNASALFILPDMGKMQQVEASLQPETLRKWKDSLKPRMIDELYLPKFSISSDYNIEDSLLQLGIREVFSTQADLSGITGTKDLRVTKIGPPGSISHARILYPLYPHQAPSHPITHHLSTPGNCEGLEKDFGTWVIKAIECWELSEMFCGSLEDKNVEIDAQRMKSTENSLSRSAFPKRREESQVEINDHQCAWQNSTPGKQTPGTSESGVTDTGRGHQLCRTAEMMALRIPLVLLMAGICPVVLCQSDGTLGRNTEVQESQNSETRVDSLTLASINTGFAFSLYKELALKNPDKNVVFSPFSISTALALLSLGASSNTLGEILEGLKFNLTETPEADIHRGFGNLLHKLSQPGDEVQINTGSMMFVGKHLQVLEEFKEKASALYQAEASTVDYQQPHEAKKLINDYVSKQTQGKIKELISNLEETTVMVLVNYIYFNGTWETPFDPRDTFESEFYLGKRGNVKVPMMHIEDLTTPYFRDEDLSCSVVELKYTGNSSALFILSDEDRMQQVEASLQPETLKKWKDSLRPRIIDELYLPKFSISTDYSLENILPHLGIREVFSTEADLSRITGAKDLQVSQVVHKAVLDVAETGICLAVLLQLYGRNTGVWENQNNGTQMDSLTLASINTDFAFSLYKELVLKNPNKNILFSPLSISSALAVLSLGARNNTLEEILEGLKFNVTETPEADIHRSFEVLLHMLSQPGDQVQIRTGSAMFIEKRLHILAEFKEKARALYQAEASTTDFQQPNEAKKLINDYVNKQTQGKIKELISNLDDQTAMVLVNYIYFNGKWETPFDPLDTFESEFYLSKRRNVKVPMMKMEDLTTPYFRDEDLSCSVVELKYTGNASALFILPDEDRMQQVEASLQPKTLRKWKDSLRPRKIDDLYIPKFSIATDYSLENILPHLGIREVFSTEADLSRITGAKDLQVSQ